MLWLDGAVVAADAARIDPADRGLLLGDGVFETIALHGGLPAHLPRHLARLRDGARLLDIPLTWTDGQIAAGLRAIGHGTGPGMGPAAARITLTRGPAPRGIAPPAAPAPTLLIQLSALPPPAGPVHAVICRITRRNQASPLSRIKSLNYLDGILARQEAARRGAAEAILLNTDGHVAEATAATVFASIGTALVTPPLADGALPGIARALILAGTEAAERRLSPGDLAVADAVFLANSLGVQPVARLEDRHYADAPALLARLRGAIRP